MKYLVTIAVALMLFIGSAKADGLQGEAAVGTTAGGIHFVCTDPYAIVQMLSVDTKEEYLVELEHNMTMGACLRIMEIAAVISEYAGSLEVKLDPPGKVWIYGFNTDSGKTLYFFHVHLDKDTRGA